MVRVQKCKYCGIRRASINISLFKFPADLERRAIWADFCSVSVDAVGKNELLCNRHFANDAFRRNDYTPGKKNYLKVNAIPTISEIPIPSSACVRVDESSEIDDPKGVVQCKKYIKGSSQKKYRYCCICGNVDIQTNPGMRFVRFPAATIERDKWLESLGMQDKFKPWYRLCILHFSSDRSLPSRSISSTIDANTYSCTSMANITDIENIIVTVSPYNYLQTSNILDSNESPQPVISTVSPLQNNNLQISNVNGTPTLRNEGNTDGRTGRKRSFRYFKHFSTPDLGTPRRKRRCLDLGRRELTQYQKKVAALMKENQRLKKKITCMQQAMVDLKEKRLLSDEALQTLRVYNFFLNSAKLISNNTENNV